MNKEFIPYQEALELKELGFDEDCFATIDQTEFVHINGTEYPMRGAMMYYQIPAPTFSQAFRWFREKYNIFPIIQPYFNSNELTWNIVFMTNFSVNEEDGDEYQEIEIIGIYEEAELACLRKLIEIVKL